MIILLVFFIHWYLSLFFQTFFLHRYASHKLYLMNPVWEKIFYFFTFIFQGSSFLHPAAYAIMHRRHHEFADTSRDPHSPIIIKNIFKFTSKTFLEYRLLVKKVLNNEVKVLDVPRWKTIENIAELFSVRLAFVLLYIIIYNYYAPSFWYYLLIPLHIFMGPIQGFIVNWFGHLIGYRNFKKLNDNSRNTLPIDILMMGELYQNNHHKKPNCRNFSYRWFEIDIAHIILLFLQQLNIIKINRKL